MAVRVSADLTSRITDALNQAEELARAALPHPGTWYALDCGSNRSNLLIVHDGGNIINAGVLVVSAPTAVASHAAHSDPRAVLEIAAAHREILALHEIQRIEPTLDSRGHMMWPRGGWACSICSVSPYDGDLTYDDGVACPTVLAIAKAHRIEVPDV